MTFTNHHGRVQLHITPGQVEFALPAGEGLRVVRVILTTPTPRVMAFSQKGFDREPMSLFLDELMLFIREAHSLLGKPLPPELKVDSD